MALAKNKITTIIILISLIFVDVLLFVFIDFDIKGHFDGIFILKNKDGKYVVKDDLYVGDADQIIYSKDFDDPKFRLDNAMHHCQSGKSHIYYEWDEKDGSGDFSRGLLQGRCLFVN